VLPVTAVRKLLFEEMPKDYSPRYIQEIIRLARELDDKEAVIYRSGRTGPCLFETSRLVIRRFCPGDAAEVKKLAVNRQNSVMKNFDHQWPTDDEGTRQAAEWFSGQENMWAVCLKPDYPLIGMIVFNSVDKNNMIDLGHVWHTDYWSGRLDTEAISLLVQYAFDVLKADGVYAGNPLECAPQLAPLFDIGMEVTETAQASFINDEKGSPIWFTG
jgi:RimJ/RimL family protein N-acetyltransferase